MQSKTFDRLIRSKDPNVLFNTNFPSGSLPAFVIQTGCLSLGVLVSKGLRSTKVYGFDIHKLADAENAKLTTMPRALDPPERQPWIRHHHGVYERLSGFELLNETLLFCWII